MNKVLLVYADNVNIKLAFEELATLVNAHETTVSLLINEFQYRDMSDKELEKYTLKYKFYKIKDELVVEPIN